MRRTEAHQGVRMIKFRSVLGRYEASEFNQMEAAEVIRAEPRAAAGIRQAARGSGRGGAEAG